MLEHVPVLYSLPLAAAMAAGVAVVAHLIFRHFFQPERFVAHHDVLAAVASIIGVLYSVVLGFLVGTVWTSFDSAQQTADQEARYIAIAYGYASTLPEPERSRIERDIARYALEVRDVEWQAMSQGRADPRARALLYAAVVDVVRGPVGQSMEARRQDAILVSIAQTMRDVANQRVTRTSQARDHLPPVIFEALILGGAMAIASAFMFGIKPIALQMTATGLLAASIGLFFGLIVDLNAPYSGPIRVSPDTWTSVIDAENLEQVAR